MGEVVNLRRVRKSRQRAAAAAEADRNRAVFGRSKAGRCMAEAGAEREKRRLDAHRIEPIADLPTSEEAGD